MNELLSTPPSQPEVDLLGSLVDPIWPHITTGSISSAYRASAETRFLVWFEGHNSALAIGPSMASGTRSDSEAS